MKVRLFEFEFSNDIFNTIKRANSWYKVLISHYSKREAKELFKKWANDKMRFNIACDYYCREKQYGKKYEKYFSEDFIAMEIEKSKEWKTYKTEIPLFEIGTKESERFERKL